MKKVLGCVVALIGIFTMGCESLSGSNMMFSKEEQDAQKSVVEQFLTEFYNYDYQDGATRCESESMLSCETIHSNIAAYVSTETVIDSRMIDALVVNPAVYSQVSVEFSELNISETKIHNDEGQEVVSLFSDVDVMATPIAGETYMTTQDIVINIVHENKQWAVIGIDFMADDYLFQKQ